MGIKKVIDLLKGYMQRGKYGKKQKKEMRLLLDKLEKREHKLEQQLHNETKKKVRKKIILSLKVIRAQQKKGHKILS